MLAIMYGIADCTSHRFSNIGALACPALAQLSPGTALHMVPAQRQKGHKEGDELRWDDLRLIEST